jgi:A/G-specific adenine glycosylase
MDIDALKAALVRKRVIDWFRQNGRSFPWRTTKDPFQILVAEMLLRRTTASAVSRVFGEFITRFDTPLCLSRARESTIAKALASLGLQTVRARQFKKAFMLISKEYDCEIPRSYDVLKSLPGVGRYIATAVMNFAYDEAVPLVDGNVIHLLSRVFGTSFVGPSDTQAWDFVSQFGGSHEPELYWGIIDLVSMVCLRKKPRCSFCPLSDVCDWYSTK